MAAVPRETGPGILQPESVVQSLRCPVCLDYFTTPHTLGCGHTFCLSCLRILARVTRTSRTRTPLERLRMRCPSCRKLTPARPVLRRKASVNYALKEVASQWFNSPLSTGTVKCILLRSQSCQTEDDDSTATADDTIQNSDAIEDISKEETREVLVHICESSSNNEVVEKQIQEMFWAPDSGDPVTSSSEDDSEPEVAPLLGDLNVIGVEEIPDLRPFFTNPFLRVKRMLVFFLDETLMVLRGLRESRSRMVLTIFWFVYGGIVVCMASGLLPWMLMYTLIYIIILYAELSPHAVLE